MAHAVGVRVFIKLLDKIIGTEAHLALLAIEKRVGEASDMAACLPNPGVHEDIGVDLEAVVALLNEALAPGLLNVVLEPCAKGTVVPSVCKTAVNFRPSKNVASVFTQGYDFIHCKFCFHILLEKSVKLILAVPDGTQATSAEVHPTGSAVDDRVEYLHIGSP